MHRSVRSRFQIIRRESWIKGFQFSVHQSTQIEKLRFVEVILMVDGFINFAESQVMVAMIRWVARSVILAIPDVIDVRYFHVSPSLVELVNELDEIEMRLDHL